MQMIKVIDISCWMDVDVTTVDECNLTESQLKVCQLWDDVFSSIAFAVIVGTKINSNDIRNDAILFFNHQPVEYKLNYHFGYYGNSDGGYTPVGVENVAMSLSDDSTDSNGIDSCPDPVENFVYREHPSKFKKLSPIPHASEYFESMEYLLKVLHTISSIALNLPKNTIQLLYESPDSIDGSKRNGNALRLSHYLPSTTTNVVEERSILYGSHTDYQGFTILNPDANDWNADGSGGLQVYLEDTGAWLPIKLPLHTYNDAFVVNSGDLIARVTNDRWKSNLHRVVGPLHRSEAIKCDRLSVVFFSGPIEDEVISVLPGMPGDPKYEPIQAQEHLLMKLKRSNVR